MQSEITSICRCAKKVFFLFSTVLHSHQGSTNRTGWPWTVRAVRSWFVEPLTILYSESNDRIVQFHYSLTRWSAVPSAVQSAGPCSLIEGVWPFEFTKLVIRTWFLYWIVRTRPKIKFELSRLKTGKEWVIYMSHHSFLVLGQMTQWRVLYKTWIYDGQHDSYCMSHIYETNVVVVRDWP